jgi:hypothetical protein
VKEKDELVIRVGGLTTVRIGTRRRHLPYINFELDGKVIAMPENKELKKLRRMIDYVLNDRRSLKKRARK